MYRVVVIDDEYYLRQALIRSEFWEKHGFQVCGQAECGVSGYNLIKEHMPHLAIVDINMPNLDGLALVKKLRDENNDLKIILLSGYSEFKYAQKAIKYKVMSYLLKPIDDEEFVKELIKIKSQLDAQYGGMQINGKADKIINDIITYINDNYREDTLSIEMICDHVSFNYHYICKLFKEKTNHSLGKYISEVRMKKAKEMINNGESNIDEVACKVGYNDTLYFSKCFKKYYGFTPTKYIKSHQNDKNRIDNDINAEIINKSLSQLDV